MKRFRRPNPRVISLECHDIAAWFAQHPDKIMEKKWHELWVAWLMCQFYEDKLGTHFSIGVPVANPEITQEAIDEVDIDTLINSTQFIADRDMDVVLGTRSESLGFQITRLVSASDHPKRKGLRELLLRKCLMQPDDCLNLVISIDEQIKTDIDELEAWINTLTVPYDTIWLLGITDKQRGEFTAIKIYPSPRLVWHKVFGSHA